MCLQAWVQQLVDVRVGVFMILLALSLVLFPLCFQESHRSLQKSVMFKAGRPGQAQGNVLRASFSSKPLLCLIGQTRVTWVLLAAREAGTGGYVAEAEHTATLNINPGLIVRKEGQLLGKQVASLWFRCCSLPECCPLRPPPHPACLPTHHFLVQVLFPRGEDGLPMSVRSPCHALAHCIQFIAWTALSTAGLLVAATGFSLSL